MNFLAFSTDSEHFPHFISTNHKCKWNFGKEKSILGITKNNNIQMLSGAVSKAIKLK